MIRLGEPIFRSVQGEGNRTGVLSIWIRFFGCNLSCDGFFQKDPADRSTFILPVNTVDPNEYSRVEDLPVFEHGCDSGYSWSSRFKHLAITYKNAEELTKDIKPLLFDGKWVHPVTKNKIDLCFTGGEPMLQQKAIIDIMKAMGNEWWHTFSNPYFPLTIQIETNGTKPLQPIFKEFFFGQTTVALNWNISPKLYYVSGEKDAVKPENIKRYSELSNLGHLKFVINNDPRAWNELNQHVMYIKEECGVPFPVYVMPVGATAEQQKDTSMLKDIANRAIDNGYHISGRLHAILFGNGVGT